MKKLRVSIQTKLSMVSSITEKSISSLKSADGLVVGSAICREITNSLNKRQNPVTKVSNMVKNWQAKFYELVKKTLDFGQKIKDYLKKDLPSDMEESNWMSCCKGQF